MACSADARVEDASSGLVFNVQRCSLHDGPGIRTTVFLKGCPLHCPWCHNPEGIDPAPELMLTAERCVSCGACVESCESGAASAAETRGSASRALCTRCGACVDACPSGARSLAGRRYEVGELVELVARDRPFYEASGGGVTFSGGEPLAQAPFLAACLRSCRGRGLHTALDTCGHAPRGTLLAVADLCDLVLYDFKLADGERHRRLTGVDNRLILDNLRALSERECELWVRVPVIAGINDSISDLDAVGRVLAALPRRHRVFLLPYHGTAAAKYARLTGGPSAERFSAPLPEALAAAGARLAAAGLEVTVGGSP